MPALQAYLALAALVTAAWPVAAAPAAAPAPAPALDIHSLLWESPRRFTAVGGARAADTMWRWTPPPDGRDHEQQALFLYQHAAANAAQWVIGSVPGAANGIAFAAAGGAAPHDAGLLWHVTRGAAWEKDASFSVAPFGLLPPPLAEEEAPADDEAAHLQDVLVAVAVAAASWRHPVAVHGMPLLAAGAYCLAVPLTRQLAAAAEADLRFWPAAVDGPARVVQGLLESAARSRAFVARTTMRALVSARTAVDDLLLQGFGVLLVSVAALLFAAPRREHRGVVSALCGAHVLLGFAMCGENGDRVLPWIHAGMAVACGAHAAFVARPHKTVALAEPELWSEGTFVCAHAAPVEDKAGAAVAEAAAAAAANKRVRVVSASSPGRAATLADARRDPLRVSMGMPFRASAGRHAQQRQQEWGQ